MCRYWNFAGFAAHTRRAARGHKHAGAEHSRPRFATNAASVSFEGAPASDFCFSPSLLLSGPERCGQGAQRTFIQEKFLSSSSCSISQNGDLCGRCR